MLVKKMTYTDYNGNERTEDFYFNLTKAEIMEMNMTAPGADLASILTRIIEEKDNKKLVEIFKDLILRAYGEKSDDGKRFVKSPEISAAFSQTEAYSDLFMELSTNAGAAAAFANGIIPQQLVDTIAAANS